MLLAEQAPPRVLVEPRDGRSNSWEDVVDLSASFGLILDPWQEDVLRAAMGERSGGKWSAAQVAVSAPRQNGKSQMIVARALAGALLFGEQKIIISAHQQGTARETFSKFMELVDESPALESRIAGVINALNREMIRFKNGSRIEFKARQGNTGRGFSSDLLMLDEAQILGQRVWATINSTMSARPNPQVWLLGTPPTPEDDGEVFTRMRQAALDGKTQRLAYLEWSADREDDPRLDETRAKANPAWHTRINHDVVQSEFETYSTDQFARERLGIWDADGAQSWQMVSKQEWGDLAVGPAEAPSDGLLAYAVKFSTDGERVGAAVALRPAEGPVHVEALGVAPLSDGTTSLVEWLASRWRQAAAIVVDGKAGAGDLVEQLIAAGVPKRRVSIVSTEEAITAHAGMLRAIQQGEVTHGAQPGLDSAVKAAGKRKIGTAGGWGWVAVTPDGDVTALDAVTLARHALMTTKRRRAGTGEAVIA